MDHFAFMKYTSAVKTRHRSKFDCAFKVEVNLVYESIIVFVLISNYECNLFPFRSNNYIFKIGFNIIRFVMVVLISELTNLFHGAKQGKVKTAGKNWQIKVEA